MSTISLQLSVLPEILAICRLPASATVPVWAKSDEFEVSQRTRDELSFICSAKFVPDPLPDHMKCEKSWRCFKVAGPMDFGLTGILAAITEPLAKEKIPLFAVSTFDTDYVLIKEEAFEHASKALVDYGHSIQ